MASNSEWKEDNQLENDIRKYVRQNFKRSEILDFVQRDFPEYTWSTATLDRRLRHFGIYYINYDTPVSRNVSYLGRNLLGVNIFMSFVIHSTLILLNLHSLLRNLSHNQSLSNSFFFPLFYFYTLRLDIIRVLVHYGVRFLFSLCVEEEGCSVVTSEVRKCEEHDREHIFITEEPSVNHSYIHDKEPFAGERVCAK